MLRATLAGQRRGIAGLSKSSRLLKTKSGSAPTGGRPAGLALGLDCSDDTFEESNEERDNSEAESGVLLAVLPGELNGLSRCPRPSSCLDQPQRAAASPCVLGELQPVNITLVSDLP